MSKDNKTPSITPEKEQLEDFTRWDYGHLIKQCYKCGQRDIMDRDVEGGISLYLPTTDKHELRLTCSRCGNSLSMFFMKSDKVKPPEEPDTKPTEESLVVDEKKVKRKIKKDEVSKGSKKEKSVQTDSESS